MKVFFSGGSPIVETSLDDPWIMLSYFVNVSRKTGKIDKRMSNILDIRKKERSKKCKPQKKKPQSKSTEKSGYKHSNKFNQDSLIGKSSNKVRAIPSKMAKSVPSTKK